MTETPQLTLALCNRHGAFAKRSLPKGTVITGTPLIHFPDRSQLEMFDPKQSSLGPLIRNLDEGPYSHQLVINYCFGRPESTLLLCPYGAGVNYINANRTQANVKVQWAHDGETNHNAEWLNTKPVDMAFELRTMLAMDYVALRDIQEGEELFLDYGDAWEQAWEDHVSWWEGIEEREEYISATQYNALYANDPIRTDYEQYVDPYPKNLIITCHAALIDAAFEELANNHPGDYENGRDFIKQIGWVPDKKGFDCDILKRHPETDTYDVSIQYMQDEEFYEEVHEGIPREAITFADSPYSTDIHLPTAFRHPIGIPDEMLPEAWRNTECRVGQQY